jgi:hypothetical protein
MKLSIYLVYSVKVCNFLAIKIIYSPNFHIQLYFTSRAIIFEKKNTNMRYNIIEYYNCNLILREQDLLRNWDFLSEQKYLYFCLYFS